jgi:hypothetical protein
MHWISIIFSASFLITFLSSGISASVNTHVRSSLSRIMMSDLLLGIVLSVRTCWFRNVVILPSWYYYYGWERKHLLHWKFPVSARSSFW